MTNVIACGTGAVTPAGWGVPALLHALECGEPLEPAMVERPGWPEGLRARLVPAPAERPHWWQHARLRRTSPIAQYLVAAALEALGPEAAHTPPSRLGVIVCTMCGGVRYTRRFYAETLQDPVTASPLVFPETVFNAPASHLAAILGTSCINYTLLGDPGVFIQGLALAGQWLVQDRVDGCLVIGAEEMDWSVADAWRLFSRRSILAEGAGAVYLRKSGAGPALATLDAVTSPRVYTVGCPAREATRQVRAELPDPDPGELLCDSLGGLRARDVAESAAWASWPGPRLSPKQTLGEAFAAGAAWQCVAALKRIEANTCPAAVVSVTGCNEQAIAARWTAPRATRVPGVPPSPARSLPGPTTSLT